MLPIDLQQIFETHSKTIIGLERLMLEASGFDFRNRYPQKLVVKIAKTYDVDRDTVGRTAYNLSLDLYRTFAPLKQTTQTMAVACVELAGRICEQRILDLESGKHFEMWHIKRGEVMGLFPYVLGFASSLMFQKRFSTCLISTPTTVQSRW